MPGPVNGFCLSPRTPHKKPIMMTRAHAKAITLMAPSSFCSHQCPGHSICFTKRPARVLKVIPFFFFVPVSNSGDLQRGISGCETEPPHPPVGRIRCLICPLE